MSFTFEWSRFSELSTPMPSRCSTNAYDKGDKLPVIADNIEVVELEMGIRCAFELYVTPMQFTTPNSRFGTLANSPPTSFVEYSHCIQR